MADKNFEKVCEKFSGKYDSIKDECTLTSDSYSKLQEILNLLEKERKQPPVFNLRSIKSKRDTNLDSFDTFDEIFDENGTVAIRRPNTVKIYNSIVNLRK